MTVIRRIDREVLPDVGRPVLAQAPQATGLQALGAGIGDVGDMFAAWQDEIDTAQAKQADAAYTDRINDLLYNDESGFMYATGGNAIARRQDVAAQIDQWREESLAGLSPAARSRAEASVTARTQAALQRINEHTATERRGYLNEAADARIASSVRSAVFDPSSAQTHLNVALNEVRDLAAREGKGDDWLAAKELEITTMAHGGIISQMAIADPVGAQTYLESHRAEIAPEEATRLEAALRSRVQDAQAQALAVTALRGQGSSAGAPGSVAEVVNAGAGWTEVRLADGSVERRNGTRAWRNNNPGNIEFGDFARSHGAIGTDGRFAVFPTYEAGRAAKEALLFESGSYAGLTLAGAIHRYAPPSENNTGAYISQVAESVGVDPNTPTASLSAEQRAAMLDAMERVEGFRAGGIDAILASDAPPEVQQEAITRLGTIQAAQAREEEQRMTAAGQEAMRILEAGGSVDSMPLELRQALVPVMPDIRRYEDQLRSGTPIQTEDAFYVDLRRMADTDPAAFLSQNPMTWRPRLDNADFKEMVELQSRIRTEGPRRPDAPAVSTVMSEAARHVEAAGLDEDASVSARLQTSYLRWADANPDLAANPVERDAFFRRQLVTVTVNPPGLNNERSGRAATISLGGETLDPADDMTLDDLMESDLTIGSTTAPREQIIAVAEHLARLNGRDPTAQEIVDALVAVGFGQ